MAESEQVLRNLLIRPRESLDLELKQWIDPQKKEGIAKIAKACIAFRNNNGGHLVIGFRDDGQPDLANAPADPRAVFHPDVVQAIVSRFSSEAFTVETQFVEVEGRVHPVITVAGGVRTPVAAKADLLGGPDEKPLIRDHTVYVRSVKSNNTVSSTEARRGDWERVTRICFDNREADIGGFVRRHLAALDLESLAKLFPALAGKMKSDTDDERVREELTRGRSRFGAAAQSRGFAIPSVGFREVVIIVRGEFEKSSTTVSFLRSMLINAPRLSGWSPWEDISASGRRFDQPYPMEEGWECLLNHDPTSLDFWRMEPRGVFYHLRAFEDDMAPPVGLRPGSQLDYYWQIGLTTEIIATGLSFARSLGCDETSTSLVFGFRWTGLTGRQLMARANPMRFFRGRAVATQGDFTSTVTVPLETPPAGIAPHVEKAMRDLFALFGGSELRSSEIDQIVTQALGGRL